MSENNQYLAGMMRVSASAYATHAATQLLELGGCRSVLLGADVPAAEIIRAVKESGPDAVVLSATLTVQLEADAYLPSPGDAVAVVKGSHGGH